jgi:hypothetical protein
MLGTEMLGNEVPIHDINADAVCPGTLCPDNCSRRAIEDLSV